MDTIYRERANGTWEYWTYSEGLRVRVAAETAKRWESQNTARIVEVRG